jgi:histone deacetylase complex regulatory component SIN3
MRQLETVQERMRKMTQDELSRYQLDNRLGGMSEVIAYKVCTCTYRSLEELHLIQKLVRLDAACIPALPTL